MKQVRKTVKANTMADLPLRRPRGALPAHRLLAPGAHNLERALLADAPARLADQLSRMGDERLGVVHQRTTAVDLDTTDRERC
jgi:hypothetical protein